MARNYARDYKEIVPFAKNYVGKLAVECIDDYADKRKIASHRAGKAFWDKVDEGEIQTFSINGYAYIKGVSS